MTNFINCLLESTYFLFISIKTLICLASTKGFPKLQRWLQKTPIRVLTKVFFIVNPICQLRKRINFDYGVLLLHEVGISPVLVLHLELPLSRERMRDNKINKQFRERQRIHKYTINIKNAYFFKLFNRILGIIDFEINQ